MNIKKSDVIWTYLARFFTLGINIILLPLIMAYLSDTDLGLWYVFASISQVVNLFDFGFNATISRHMTYASSGAKNLRKTSVGEYSGEEKNEELMSEVIATCKLVYFAISLAALFVMLTIGTIYIYQVTKSEMTINILLAWLVYAFAVFLNLLYGYWASLLQGIGAVAERHKMNVYAKIIQLVLAFGLLLGGMGLLGFVISYAVSGIALRLIGRHYFLRNTREVNLKHKIGLERIRECFFTIWGTAWKDGLVMLAQYLSTQANTLVCAYFVDLSSTSAYGIITQIGSMMGALAASYYSAYQPQYSSLCLKREKDEIKKLTCRCGLVYKVFFAIIFLAFIVVGIPVLHIIRPSMKFEMGMVIAICVFYYLYNQHSMYCSMIASTNRIPYYKCFVMTALGSITLSVFLTGVFHFEIWGLISAQLLTNLVCNNWYWIRFVMKEQEIKYLDIYRIGIGELNKRII